MNWTLLPNCLNQSHTNFPCLATPIYHQCTESYFVWQVVVYIALYLLLLFFLMFRRLYLQRKHIQFDMYEICEYLDSVSCVLSLLFSFKSIPSWFMNFERSYWNARNLAESAFGGDITCAFVITSIICDIFSKFIVIPISLLNKKSYLKLSYIIILFKFLQFDYYDCDQCARSF